MAKKTLSYEEMVAAAMTGRVPPEITDPRDAIEYLYGKNSKGNPNAKAASEDLGISERQIRRYITTDLEKRAHPKGTNATKIQNATTTANDTRKSDPTWRQSQMPKSRQKRFEKNGLTMSFDGTLRYSKDTRDRSLKDLNISAEDAAALAQAWVSGSAQAYERALQDAINAAYLGDYAGFAVVRVDDITVRHS
ncbi:hypothetical protein ACFV9C_42405 [Kribbella sp. NPDC059898]|uniref:hypothetical protein n=1 Tax=Kribbella sp. NPDC059898 TaxID=3346995 RepID=UPI003655D7EB